MKAKYLRKKQQKMQQKEEEVKWNTNRRGEKVKGVKRKV